jgi:hypothetical protein
MYMTIIPKFAVPMAVMVGVSSVSSSPHFSRTMLTASNMQMG